MGVAVQKKFDTWTNGFIHFYQNFLGDIKPTYQVELDKLEQVQQCYKNIYDLYETQNTFKNGSRRTEDNLLQLRKFFIDIDNVVNVNETINNINELVEQDKLPQPTQIIFSGRGLHLKWEIKDYVSNNKNLTVWKKVQDYFYKTLKHLGADIRAKDPCRLLRVVGSINSKSNMPVKELIKNETGLYDLYNVYNKYIPYVKPKTKKSNKVKQLPIKNLFTLNQARLQDLKTLVQLRQGEVVGYRNCLIMLYAFHYRLEHTVTVDELIKATKQFNKMFAEPLKIAEIESTCRSCNRRAKEFLKGDKTKSAMGNKVVIESLNITTEEQKQLSTLISKTVRKENQSRREKAIRRNENGLTNREQQKQDTIKVVQELKEQGLKQTEVAEKLMIGIATVKRYWNNKNH